MTTQLVMGFDFGLRRIGVAVGQQLTGTASPVAIVGARDGIPEWDKIEKLLGEWQPGRLVVGLPLNMDGTRSEMSERAEKFSRRLGGRFNLPVDTIDERLSSREARSLSGKESDLDAIAAVVILQSWLEEHANS